MSGGIKDPDSVFLSPDDFAMREGERMCPRCGCCSVGVASYDQEGRASENPGAHESGLAVALAYWPCKESTLTSGRVCGVPDGPHAGESRTVKHGDERIHA
jgi:hypothetical protein